MAETNTKLSLVNNQNDEYRNIFVDRLPKVVKDVSVDYSFYSIDFDLISLPIDGNVELHHTAKTTVNVNMTVKSKTTGEQCTTPIAVVDVPVLTSTGLKIDGTIYQPLPRHERASGWYILEDKTELLENITMELFTRKSSKLVFSNKNNIIRIHSTIGKKTASSSVNIAYFLKAVTGLSFIELARMLGMTNKYVISTFSVAEPSIQECIDTVLPAFTKNESRVRNYDLNRQVQDLKKRIFSPKFLNLGPTATKRSKRDSLFLSRARNKTLARTVKLADGNEIKEGSLLSEDILNRIDVDSTVDTIFVKNESKKYELKKYSIEDNLTVNEFLTFVNMYACALDGYPLLDDRYTMDNRYIVTFSDMVCEEVRERLSNYVDQIEDHLSKMQIREEGVRTGEQRDRENDQSFDAREAVIPSFIQEASMPPLGEFIESLKRDCKEMQGTETTNSLSYIAKSFKTFTDFGGRAVEDMVRVRESQFNRFDPSDSPESGKVGLVNHRTLASSIDENGFITAMFYKVKNGVVDLQGGLQKLTADSTNNKYIASWNETFENDEISCRFNDRIVKIPKSRVDLIEASVLCGIGPSTIFLPFINHSNGKRIVMESNQSKQAIPVLNPERPIVSTGGAGLISYCTSNDFGILRARSILAAYYYENETLLSEITDFDEFVQLPIILKNMEKIPNYRVLTFETIVDGEKYSIVHNIPYMQRNTKDCLYSMRVNTETKGIFQGEDIVAFNIDVDIEKYNLVKEINLGNLEVEDSLFDFEWGAGTNLRVGYKTFGSSSIDDGIVISDELVNMDILTTVTIKEFEVELDVREDYREFFGTPHDNKKEFYLDKKGLPELNTYLKPGSTVIAMYGANIDPKTGKPDLNTTVDKSIKLDAVTEGEVVYTNISDKYAIVQIASLARAEEGDKLAGRFGNKGVIARIVPQADMPFDPETGKPLQIMLNPLGVPSRMNISQVLECVLAFAMQKQNKKIVISPKHPKSLEIVKNYVEEAGVKPMVLRDGRTGQLFKRPMAVGFLYFWKLEHLVRNKVTAVGLPKKLSLTFNQPMKGRAVIGGGGQSIGEMETWCFQASGCNEVLQDLISSYSDDFASKKAFENYQKTNMIAEEYPQTFYDYDHNRELDLADMLPSFEGESHNDYFIQYLMRSAGVEILTDVDANNYRLVPLTDDKIRELASRPVDLNNKKNWLHDPGIFGYVDCQAQAAKSRTKWGYMELYTEIVHPLWVEKSDLPKMIYVKKAQKNKDGIVYKPCCLNSNAFKEILAGKLHVSFSEDIPRVNKTLEDSSFETGMQALVTLLRKSDFADTKNYYKGLIAKCKKPEDKFAYNKFIETVDFLEKNGFTFADFVVKHFPIMPQIVRVPMKGLNSKPDFDILYDNLAKKALKCKNSPQGSNTLELYRAVQQLTGFVSEKDSLGSSDKDVKNLLNYFVGKNEDKRGVVRDNLLSKRISNSFRSVIIPIQDSKKINTTQIGIPFKIALISLKPSILEILKRELEVYNKNINYEDVLTAIMNETVSKFEIVVGVGPESSNQVFSDVKKKIIGFIEKQVVVAGRQPSLHRFSIRAYRPVVVYTNAIQIHPLVCSAYNADFDGDQMWGAFIIRDAAKKQAMQSMMTNTGLVNPKDGSMVIEPSQDMILGCYFATMLFNNVTNIKDDTRYDHIWNFDSVEKLKLSVECGNIEPHELVCYYRSENDRTYLSTAGRILFNSILPDGFTEDPFTNPLALPEWKRNVETDVNELINVSEGETPSFVIKSWLYSELKYDGLMKKKADKNKNFRTCSLSKVVENLVANFDGDKAVQVLHDIMEFGFYFSDISAISFTLDDIVEHPRTDEIINKAESLTKKVYRDYSLGLMTEEDRINTIIAINNNAKDYLKDILLDPKKGSAFTRNNNIFIISDSGSRGNISQIMQTCGIIGPIKKTSSEILESPILSNYFRGLSSQDMESASYGTRDGVATQQNGTADAGYSTRQAEFMTNGFVIVEHDCGKEVEPMKVLYSEPKQSYDYLLLGKTIVADDSDAYKYVKAFVGSSRKLSKAAIDIIYKHHVHKVNIEEEVELEDGTLSNSVRLEYKMDKTFSSMLIYREVEGYQSTDKTADNYIPALINNKYLTEKSVSYIEDMNFEKLNVRLMLDCNSKGGCCARCYGLKFSDKMLPVIGETVGVETAQAVGEPSAQLKLDTINQGGVGSADSGGGLALFESKLRGGLPSKSLKAILAPYDGVIEVSEISNTCILSMDDFCKTVDKSLVIVKNKEYVEAGQPLTLGLSELDKICEGSTRLDVVRKRQLESIKQYHRVFTSSNLMINARHFEILVRQQSTLVKVFESNDPNLKAGSMIFLPEILESRANGYSVEFLPEFAKQKDVCTAYGGFLNTLFFEDFGGSLSKISLNSNLQSFKQGFIAKIGIGQNLTKNIVKKLVRAKNNDVYVEKEVAVDDVKVTNVLEEVIVSNEDLFSNLDLGNMTDFGNLDDLDLFDDLDDSLDVDLNETLEDLGEPVITRDENYNNTIEKVDDMEYFG